ncbi:hypothetical protein TIFTF001_040148 [Ficus carica]|uniref:Uncharacterized protein n=1 Tax=Ficus carica TaxID=3494 RepID=A0AA88CIF6_FICCA|nr:hypothetical protein TIFTF001_040146 [Ficus carica]GMN21953.1 hypothetical protein TIFTF001_040148 [Ficus carica]
MVRHLLLSRRPCQLPKPLECRPIRRPPPLSPHIPHTCQPSTQLILRHELRSSLHGMCLRGTGLILQQHRCLPSYRSPTLRSPSRPQPLSQLDQR